MSIDDAQRDADADRDRSRATTPADNRPATARTGRAQRRRAELPDRPGDLRRGRRTGHRVHPVGRAVHRLAQRGVHRRALRRDHGRRLGVRAVAPAAFVVFALWLAFSRYGKIPLGRDGEPPEFRTVSWIAMMFSAGMGIGLMFYGVAEPLSHFTSPPPGTVAGRAARKRSTSAMATTLFHWTLHPWAIYAVVGLAIAYSTLPARPPAADQLGVRARCSARSGPSGPLGQGHRHPGDLRHPVRLGRVAGPRRAADRRPGLQANGLPARSARACWWRSSRC